MQRVVSIHPLEHFRLEVSFDNGTRGVISLADRLFGPMFESLRDPAYFRQAFVDEFGVVSWPNGADLAPDALYEQLRTSAGASPA